MTNQDLWTERVAAWRASGVTAYRFAQDRDLSSSALYYWIRKLDAETVSAAPATEVRFARVTPVSPQHEAGAVLNEAVLKEAARTSPSPVIVDVGRARVTVPAGASRTVVEMVLGALLHRADEVAR